jgi:hypothetical protein
VYTRRTFDVVFNASEATEAVICTRRKNKSDKGWLSIGEAVDPLGFALLSEYKYVERDFKKRRKR